MSSYLAPVLGVLAGVVGVMDTIPYIRDTAWGRTRPHRGTWLIWGALAIVVCLSQRADGASWSLIMAAVQAALTSVIFLLSIRRGEGGLGTTDLIMIAIAGAGVVGWIVADQPIISLLLYPAYFCLVNFAIAVLIVYRRRALAGRPGLVGPARTG